MLPSTTSTFASTGSAAVMSNVTSLGTTKRMRSGSPLQETQCAGTTGIDLPQQLNSMYCNSWRVRRAESEYCPVALKSVVCWPRCAREAHMLGTSNGPLQPVRIFAKSRSFVVLSCTKLQGTQRGPVNTLSRVNTTLCASLASKNTLIRAAYGKIVYFHHVHMHSAKQS